MSLISKIGRAIKVIPDLVLGNGAEKAGQAMRTAIKNKESIFTAAKEGVLKVEELSKSAGFFTRITSNIGAIGRLTKAGAKLGAKKGIFASIVGGTKGFFKGIGKNMPLIGALMMIGFEIPNIVKASKEQGIGQGIKEIVKAGSRLCGGGIGAAIGSAICPGLGTMIGWIAGEWLIGKVVGKSYSEKVAQAEYEAQMAAEQQAQAQAEMAQQPVFQGNPYQPQVQPQVVQQPAFQGNPYQPQVQPQVAQQPAFQGNPYPQQESAVTNPFTQQTNADNFTNLMGNNTLDSYNNDIFARNIDFNQLALNMTNNITSQNPMQQQLQLQPQVSIINP